MAICLFPPIDRLHHRLLLGRHTRPQLRATQPLRELSCFLAPSTVGQSSFRPRRRSPSLPCTTRQMVYLPFPEPHSCPPNRPLHPRPTRHHHHSIRRIRRPPPHLARCRARPRQARSRICKAYLTRTSAPVPPPPQVTTMSFQRARRRPSTASGAGASRPRSREAPKSESEPELVARNRFRCVRHRRLIETAYLRGLVLVVRRMSPVSPAMEVEMIVVVDARIGRRTVDMSVRVVMGLHVMWTTMVTRSTSLTLKWRIRTRCAKLLSPKHFYSSPFFGICGSAPHSL